MITGTCARYSVVLEEQFSQACQSKLAVRPQGPHEPLETVPEKHVVIGAFPDQRLVEVQPVGGWAQASLPVVEAPERRRCAVRLSEVDVARAICAACNGQHSGSSHGGAWARVRGDGRADLRLLACE